MSKYLKHRSKALIIHNPKSGRQPKDIEEKIKTISQKFAWKGELIKTTLKLSAKKIASDAIKKGIRHIIICGGDGTVREVLSQAVKHQITIGIVPLGTGNIFAKNMNIPLGLEDSLKVAFAGKTKVVDVGVANDNFFVLIAGMGLDVDAMSAPQEDKNRFKTFAYINQILKNFSKKPDKYKIIINDKTEKLVRAKSVLVANIGTTEAGIKIVPHTNPQSGDFKIGIIKASNFTDWLDLTVNILKGDINLSRNYKLFEGQKIEIIPVSGPKPFECDGEVFPSVPKLVIKIYPQAISVLVP